MSQKMAKKPWHCGRKNCTHSQGWHNRRYVEIEETVGRQAAEEFEREHPDPDQEDE